MERVLAELGQGTPLFKVKSPTKMLERTFYLDMKNMCVYYDGSKKKNRDTSVRISKIREVREGEKDYSKKLKDLEKNLCFVIIMGSTQHALYIMAEKQQTRDKWVRGLRYAIQLDQLAEQRDETDRNIRDAFNMADRNGDGSLDFDEVMKLLKTLNADIKKKYAREMFNAADTNKNGKANIAVLDREEFVNFYHKLTKRVEVEEVFLRFSRGKGFMTLKDILTFLREGQKMKHATEEDCRNILDQFEPDKGLKMRGHLSADESIDFQRPKWTEWKSRFSRYRIASKLTAETGEVQVATLIYSMGKEAENIFSSFVFETEENKQNYDMVLQKFEEHFIPKRNIIWERSRFHQRIQQDGESVEEFIRSLFTLSEYCEFTDKNIQIRDRLVIGLKDKEVCKKLQLKEDLTLEKAQEIARHHELIKAQNHQAQAYENIDAVKSRHKKHDFKTRQPQFNTSHGKSEKFSHHSKPSFPQARKSNEQQGKKCGKCGKSHAWGKCPAYGKVCHKCHKLSHFAAMCRNKNVHEVDADEMEEKDYEYFIGSIEGKNVPPWTTCLDIMGHNVHFKIDTGADVNILNEDTWVKVGRPQLQSTLSRLTSPGGELKTLGKLQVSVMNKDIEVFVIKSKGQQNNLLGRTTASEMGLVKFINNITEYPKINCEPVKIKLKKDAQPYAIPVARRVPIPLMKKVETELKNMEDTGVIQRISEPTEWVSPIVPVVKPTGQVRICVDLKKLNQNVERERYIIPTVDDIIHKVKDSKVFSKLDAASGYHQIPLDVASAKLTTFITPFGRYYFKRLPFGISSGPEIFQRLMEEILENMEGVVCYFDDVLIHTVDEESHKQLLNMVKEKLQKAGLKLNEQKCTYFQKEIKFLGHIVSQDGVKPDPEKVEAIQAMPEPTNLPELRRFLGMIQYLGRYMDNLATILSPLNMLLQSDVAWTWGAEQQEAFKRAKRMLTESKILAYYDVNKDTIVSADASQFGLGAVLLQQHEGGLKPVAYCSRTLTDTEKRYAQIEKECLAATWACERFEKYLVGMEKFSLYTDHKPLVPLINNKQLTESPLRCQRMLMRLMRFKVTAVFVPGKNMVIADTLSRCPRKLTEKDDELQTYVKLFVEETVSAWPVSDKKLEQIKHLTQEDVVMSTAMDYTRYGWPEHREDVKIAALTMFPFRNELSEIDGILVKGDRIVIPYDMRKEVLERIHEGHMGITKCKERAKESVWWPQINQEIKDRVSRCRQCIEKKPTQTKEPLLTSQLPERPFQKVGIDICEFKKNQYLVLQDFYSRYLEIMHLPNMSSHTVICKLKCCFARYGIPECVVSDNARQFTSSEFASFSTEWNFKHVTSSPRFPQSNGFAERAVKTAKEILSQDDVFLAILAYRSTPLSELGVSPAKLMFERNIRNTLPCLPKNLRHNCIDRNTFEAKDRKAKQRQKMNFDRHHGVRNLPDLQTGDPVLVKTDEEKQWKTQGRVLHKTAPRSYVVRTDSHGDLRRNRRHLKKIPEDSYLDLDPYQDSTSETVGEEDSSSQEQEKGLPSTAPTAPNSSGAGSTTQLIPQSSPVAQQTPLRRSQRQVKAPKRLIAE